MRKQRSSLLITGIPAARVKLKAGLTLLRLAPSPKALFLLLRQRRRLHGNKKDHKIVASGNRYFWSIYTPGFPSPGFNAMIQQELRRAYEPDLVSVPLQTLILSISSRCHYQCEHCYEGNNLGAREKLPVAVLAKVLREAIELRVPHIQIGGGEPMLRFRDLISLLELGKGHLDFWLSTSGYELTRDKAYDLKIAGLTGATISLDHWEAKKHNNFRRHPEAFKWATEAVEHCKAVGIIPNLTLCVTHEMANEENLMHYMTLARHMGVPFVRFLEAQKAGSYAGKDVLLTKEEQATLVQFYLKMNGSKKYRSYPIIQYPGYHQRKLGCFGAGNRYMHIDSAGNYHSCPFCRGAVGNIREMELKEGIRLLRKQGCQLFKTNVHA